MQRLRQARFLARLVLAWFALSLGVAVASPLVKPQALQLVCSAAGTVKLLPADGADDNAAGHLLDCPLCIATAPPPDARPAEARAFERCASAVAVQPRLPGEALRSPPARGPPPLPA